MSVLRTSELDATNTISTGDLFDISQDQGGSVYISKKITFANLSSSGFSTTYAKLDASNQPFTNNITINGSTDNIQLKIKSNATQTTTPFSMYQSDNSTIIHSVDNSGNMSLLGAATIYPSANSTAALKIGQANKTVYATFDSTNKRLRLGDATVPTATLDILGLTILNSSGNIGMTAGKYIYPLANSTTAINIADAAGTAIVTVDTTNKYLSVTGGSAQSTISRGLVVNTGLISGATGVFNAKGSVDQSLIITDTVNDRVGIGVDSPTVKLDIGGSLKLGAASTDIITCTGRLIPRTVASDPTANNTAGNVGEIVFYSNKWYGKTVGTGTDTNWGALN